MIHIVIIGAGPAGLMAAATVLENIEDKALYEIHIFEKNQNPGKKLLISGGGRCNITTTIQDKKILSTKYMRGWDFIKKSMGKFSPKKCFEWFESHNLPLKIEVGDKVFPESNDGKDVLEIFSDIFAKYRNNVNLHYGEGVSDVSVISSFKKNGSIQNLKGMDHSFHRGGGKGSELYQIRTTKGSYEADILIIATGGNAYSQTGSTGDGYAFARSLGHSITPLGPSLSSFITVEKWIHGLSGIVLDEAMIDGLKGSLLFTHFGISGPLSFMVSAKYAWTEVSEGKKLKLKLTPIASMGMREWDDFLRQSFEKSPKKYLINILSGKLPRRFSEAFIEEYFREIASSFVGNISKNNRENIARNLGIGLEITLNDRRPGEEFVTAGGVDTSEIDAETMESKIHKNLYFAGEILNVDGYTGGFSLQICWSSGFVSGKNISNALQEKYLL